MTPTTTMSRATTDKATTMSRATMSRATMSRATMSRATTDKALMPGYNRVNGDYCAENAALVQAIFTF